MVLLSVRPGSQRHDPHIPLICHSHMSHYHDSELTSACPIRVIPSAKLDSDKYQILKSLHDSGFKLPTLCIGSLHVSLNVCMGGGLCCFIVT